MYVLMMLGTRYQVHMHDNVFEFGGKMIGGSMLWMMQMH